jgi:phage repressor protein C with HTH and peptisase S24 domain
MNEVNKPVDPVRKFVAGRIADLGLDMAAVSRAIGRNHAYIQQFLKSHTPKTLPEKVRPALAQILNCEEIDLMDGVVGLNSQAAAQRPGKSYPPNAVIGARVSLGVAPKLREDIPVYVTARCGAEGAFEMNKAEPVEWRARPAKLTGVPGVYGVILDGDSMSPVHEAGDLIYVSEVLPPLVGRDVVIQLRPSQDGENPPAYLKRLVRRGSTDVECEQFNPKRVLTFKVKDILTIHRVLKLSEIV